MGSKRRKVMLVLFALALLITAFLAAYIYIGLQKLDSASSDSIRAEIAAAKGLMALCDKIGDPQWQDDCRIGVILAKNAPEECESLGSPRRAADCLKAFGARSSRIVCREGAVAGAREYADYCASGKPLNLSSCQMIAAQRYCFAQVAFDSRDAKVCDGATGPGERDGCLLVLAQSTNDSTQCEGITDDAQKIRCRTLIVPGDVSECASLNDFADRERCTSAATRRKCALAPPDIVTYPEYDARCVTDAAITLADPAVCERISDEFWKEGCYFEVAARLNRKEICEGLDKGSPRNTCYFKVATMNSDPGVCYSITTSGGEGAIRRAHESPIQNLAMRLGGAYALNLLIRDSCFAKSAALVNDVKLCDLIQYKSMKNLCIDAFALD